VENFYLTTISLAVGLLNSVLMGLGVHMMRKLSKLDEHMQSLHVKLEVLHVQLRERGVINGSAKIV